MKPHIPGIKKNRGRVAKDNR